MPSAPAAMTPVLPMPPAKVDIVTTALALSAPTTMP
jgi:hypothetical protein